MADQTPFATNSASVQTQALDYTKPQAPLAQSYHGGAIMVNSNVVGRIEEWHPAGAYTRNKTHCYEINNKTWGVPVDIVPGIATGFNITFTRSEVWAQELEITLGYGATGGAVWENLTDQTFPFQAQEFLYQGATVYRVWTYYGCWFTEKNPTSWTSEGDGRIKVTCGMVYISRKKTT